MSRALTLSALLAWMFLQVPVVLCSTSCQTSAKSVLGFAAHSCHDVHAGAHQRDCASAGADLAGETRSIQARSVEVRGVQTRAPVRGPDGHHVVLLVQSAPAGAPVTLPALVQIASLRGWTEPELACGREPETRPDALMSAGPDDATDLVSASVQLQV
jgi:hypothetical protein